MCSAIYKRSKWNENHATYRVIIKTPDNALSGDFFIRLLIHVIVNFEVLVCIFALSCE